MSLFISALSGLVFGLGLILSGMANPAKVSGFLDLAGAWDPSLALVMGGAVGVGLIGFALAKRRRSAWNGDAIDLPTSTVIDRRLLIGGLLFGAGWGIGGYCPGPALVSAGSGSSAGLLFVGAMLAGMALHDRLFARR
ncbi:YeeE/YedE family protein [Piscinibacter sp. Jin2]|uniref:YeeE/YedE family protein n=1 Tax=Aquariibacter lacus TaxID=2801332 RepID=A0A9X0XF45_9BURK|nr:DUF6691 family protein [Piscinibacter lacus]MBL0718295.1 YeeE/YedE family protein [Piscinibacter lacus]